MDDNFDLAFHFTLGAERGYVDNPRDPGGATNLGISLRFLKNLKWRVGAWLVGDMNRDGRITEQDIRLLSIPVSKQVYRHVFWEGGHCDVMPPYLDIVFFDWAVNHGIQGATKTLQQCLGVMESGIFDPRTHLAMQRADTRQLVNAFQAARIAWYQRSPRLKDFPGWIPRVHALTAYVDHLEHARVA